MTAAIVAFIVSLAVAVVYGVIFKSVYPLVDINTGLALSFGLAGLLTYAAARAVLLKVKRKPNTDT
jgi:hypothetical protein